MQKLTIKLKEENYKELHELTQTFMNIALLPNQEKVEASPKDMSNLLSGLLNLKEFRKLMEEYKKLANELSKGGIKYDK